MAVTATSTLDSYSPSTGELTVLNAHARNGLDNLGLGFLWDL